METVITKDRTFTHSSTSNTELDRFDWVAMPTVFSERVRIDRKENLFAFLNGVARESQNLSSLSGLTVHGHIPNTRTLRLAEPMPSFTVCADKNWLSSSFHIQTRGMVEAEINSCHWVDIWKNSFVKDTNVFSAEVANISFLEKLMNSVGRTLLSRIKALEKVGKKQEAIKEAHKSIDDLQSIDSIKIINSLLKQVSSSNFSLPILVAFLASTKKIKDNLPNRNSVFLKAQELAIAEIGIDRFNKSIFNSLK